jgi:hypothetical protein
MGVSVANANVLPRRALRLAAILINQNVRKPMPYSVFPVALTRGRGVTVMNSSSARAPL